jgi:hypothetical protein
MDQTEWWANDDEGNVGGTVMLNVHYRIKENDPYNLPSVPPTYPYIFDGGTASTAVYDDIIGA